MRTAVGDMSLKDARRCFSLALHTWLTISKAFQVYSLGLTPDIFGRITRLHKVTQMFIIMVPASPRKKNKRPGTARLPKISGTRKVVSDHQ